MNFEIDFQKATQFFNHIIFGVMCVAVFILGVGVSVLTDQVKADAKRAHQQALIVSVCIDLNYNPNDHTFDRDGFNTCVSGLTNSVR